MEEPQEALQGADGSWAYPRYESGMTALAALTLLECKVRPDDPTIRKALAAVRRACPRMSETYALALTILFLDRLGEPLVPAVLREAAA